MARKDKITVTCSNFADLGIAESILRAILAENYHTPTPIQAQAIPPLLAGQDVIGIAQTGTGKTAAFSLPMLQRLTDTHTRPQPGLPRGLILVPTRELAIQVADAIRTYGRHLPLRHTVILGGVGQMPQVKALARGVDILVATPGRLLDLIDQRHVRLDAVSFFVLDEADRMLDMGFIRDIRKIVALLPAERQSLLFSATMPTDIVRLAGTLLREPVRIEVTPASTPVERIEQRVFFVDSHYKRDLLTTLLNDQALARVIVFTRTKHGADRVAALLERAGVVAEAIHGNKSQGSRQRALERFRSGFARVLVATDIAARGIDVDEVTHVINYELPNVPESYIHRVGRTARAGANGVALSFCDPTERPYLRDIERLMQRSLVITEHAYPNNHASAPRQAPAQLPSQRPLQRPANVNTQRPPAQRPRMSRQRSA